MKIVVKGLLIPLKMEEGGRKCLFYSGAMMGKIGQKMPHGGKSR